MKILTKLRQFFLRAFFILIWTWRNLTYIKFLLNSNIKLYLYEMSFEFLSKLIEMILPMAHLSHHTPLSMYNHETIIWTEITCKNYIRDSASRWLIVESPKIFWSHAKYFWVFPPERNCRILTALCKQVFMNHPIMFLDQQNKTKLVPTSFLPFRTLTREK